MSKYLHPASSAGIRTHDLLITNLLPWPLNQGGLPRHKLYFLYSKLRPWSQTLSFWSITFFRQKSLRPNVEIMHRKACCRGGGRGGRTFCADVTMEENRNICSRNFGQNWGKREREKGRERRKKNDLAKVDSFYLII